MTLKPYISFFGGKYRAAPHYPTPMHEMIVEPFAGSAGYSVRWAGQKVRLFDKDPVVIETWRYLINAAPKHIMALPDLREGETVKDAAKRCGLEPGAQHLIGWWLNKGTTRPSASPGKWMRDYQAKQTATYWGPGLRKRLASQLDAIKGWTAQVASYGEIDIRGKCTWFIDPPYNNKAGRNYRCSSKDIDYAHLAEWCRARKGQVIVCENVGADWLPFKPHRVVKGLEGRNGGKQSHEAIWTNT